MANSTSETLGDFVRRARKEKNLTLRAVSNRSARFGERITAGYISRIENDPRLRVTVHRLTALANGLGIPIHDLMSRVIRVVPSEYTSEELELVAMYKGLSPERRADVLMIIEVLHR